MLVRIDQFEVVDGVGVFFMSHVHCENRQGILWSITSFFYPSEGIDCKRMAQRVWSSTTDVSVADNLFGLSESDFFYCLVEIVTNLPLVQALVLISDQEI